MVSTAGKYEYEKGDGEAMDDYLNYLGVGLVLRKVLTTTHPTIEILFFPDTDEWMIKTETPFKAHTSKFKIGQRIEDETFDARKCTTIGEVSSEDKIVLQQKCEEGPDVTVSMEKFEDTKLRVTLQAANNAVSTTRIYRKVPN